MILLIFALLITLNTKTSLAFEEFTTSQNTTYKVDHLGNANVSQDIKLINNYSQIYAKEYQINITGPKINNIIGNDNNGSIIDKVVRNQNVTEIYLKFEKPIIGKNQTNSISLNYKIDDFAIKKGNTWEIQFPLHTSKTNNKDISVLLEVPESFGELSFSSIPTTNIHTVGNITQIRYIENPSINKKILMIFGNHQLFDFKLLYYLDNPNSYDIKAKIPIPPDTNYQTIIFNDINIAPINVNLDSDGNWLADYLVPAHHELDIVVTGQAKIHPPTFNSKINYPSNLINSDIYWPVSDPEISNISKNLNNPKQIYEYVVNKFDYNYENINFATRKGVLEALKNPAQALCTEFTDLFITLARSKEIPAREIEGYAYSNNSKIKPINTYSDVLHAWPEYFNSTMSNWVQIDPTWEKTTNGIDYFSELDLNHLTFVTHGTKSNYPPPPGYYKRDKNDKTVFVDFATIELKPTYQPLKIILDENKLKIINNNLFAVHAINIRTGDKWNRDIKLLPPLGSTNYDFPKMKFIESLMPNSKQYQYTVTSNESPTPEIISINNQQHYFNLAICIGISVFLLSLGGIILTATHKST